LTARPAFRQLLLAILAQYRLNPNGIHGVPHWGRVVENGRRLAAVTGADLAVVEMFAIFHDACRRSDGWDPDHGPRGAALARGLRALTGLHDAQFGELVSACEHHTSGPGAVESPTVLTCLDADRLDIPRVGMRTKPELLMTAAAREQGILGWAAERAAGLIVPALCLEEWNWRP
jgi:uncharacterized protein